MISERKWLSIELDRNSADKFRKFLKISGIRYEASECWERIHFEVLANEPERNLCECALKEMAALGMSTNAEWRKLEAIVRMETILQLSPDYINGFRNCGEVPLFAAGSCDGFGVVTEMLAPDWVMELIRRFERDYNALVYCSMRSLTTFGELISFLYVSGDFDDWEMERKDLTDGYPLAYVENLDTPCYSEFGSIKICEMAGVVIRDE